MINSDLSKPQVLYLSRSEIEHLGGNSSQLYMDAVEHALKLHASEDIVQPLKPYLRWYGNTGHIADRIIAMPAYLGGAFPIAGLKWVGSKHDNPSHRQAARASAVIVLNDPESHYPIAVMEGSLISGMRTAAVTAIAVRHLAKPSFSHVSCVGCGPIARMQLCTLLEQFPFIEAINLFDLRTAAAENLSEHLQVCFPEVKCTVASTAELAIREGDIVIPCTVTDKPYIHYEWLKTGAFVSNVSVMDVHKEVFLKADKVIVDDWEQANREKKIINQLVLEGRFSRENLHAELSEIITGQQPGREANEEIIILNPMGMAIEDIACAQSIYQFALNRGIGTWLNLY